MKHLYFVRHGLSEANAAGLWSGSTDTPLSKEGKKQATLAGQDAKGLHIDHIISSPLSRAHDTAKIIAKEIGYPVKDIELNSLLVERHLGALEGTVYNSGHPAYDFDLDGIADIELQDTLETRVRMFVDHLQTIDHATILVVSHGATGRMLRHVTNPNIPFWIKTADPIVQKKLKLGNAQIIKLI